MVLMVFAPQTSCKMNVMCNLEAKYRCIKCEVPVCNRNLSCSVRDQ